MKFRSFQVRQGQRVRVHTGKGTVQLIGNTWHVYAERQWFVWNNDCGDSATLLYNGAIVDSAYYDPRPPEGELIRQVATNKLVPRYKSASGW